MSGITALRVKGDLHYSDRAYFGTRSERDALAAPALAGQFWGCGPFVGRHTESSPSPNPARMTAMTVCKQLALDKPRTSDLTLLPLF